ncbi:MAG TPA: DUF5666 domain-containing protein [Acidimicrobiia bacterium]|nr:DUF5666 domain-containing protein [Acidimicrobiia bacterium]
METTQTSQGTGSAKGYDLDAMGLGPPTKVRRRGKVDKWTRILGVAVILLLVFYIGVRMGHASRPRAAAPTGGAGAGTGAGGGGAGANAGTGVGAGAGASGGPGAGAAKPAATGTIKVVDGNTIYVGQPDGTTTKIVVNDSTRFTRTVPADLRDIQPGDRVTVEGSKQPDGTVNAVRIDGQASALQQG